MAHGVYVDGQLAALVLPQQAAILDVRIPDGIHGQRIDRSPQRAVPVHPVGRGHPEVGEQWPGKVVDASFWCQVRPLRHFGQWNLPPQLGGGGGRKGQVADGLGAVLELVMFQPCVDGVTPLDLIGEDGACHPARCVEGSGEKAVLLHHVHRDVIPLHIRLEDTAAQGAGGIHMGGQCVQQRPGLGQQPVGPVAAGAGKGAFHGHQAAELPGDGGAQPQAVDVLFLAAPGPPLS